MQIEFHVPIFNTFREINRQKALRSGQVGSEQAVSASPKMIKNIYSDFLKVLDLLECRRGDK